jgi:DNA-damage-inducible protein D
MSEKLLSSKELAELAFSSSFKTNTADSKGSPSSHAIENLIGAFEDASQTDDSGVEFWTARHLASLLGYTDYRNFLAIVQKAKDACKNSGQELENHFVDVTEMVEIGSDARREISDIRLTRYAAYLIAQNGDSRKKPVAFAQTYAIFQNFGYKGLYAGLDKAGVQQRKGLKSKENPLDHMGSTELAANLFRATQTEDKLRREQTKGKLRANQLHYDVGKRVRQTIRDLGGTMPENLPPAENIEKVAKRLKSVAQKNTEATELE